MAEPAGCAFAQYKGVARDAEAGARLRYPGGQYLVNSGAAGHNGLGDSFR